MNHPCYQFHGHSTKETDPLVDGIVITDEPMNHERAMETDQAAPHTFKKFLRMIRAV